MGQDEPTQEANRIQRRRGLGIKTRRVGGPMRWADSGGRAPGVREGGGGGADGAGGGSDRPGREEVELTVALLVLTPGPGALWCRPQRKFDAVELQPGDPPLTDHGRGAGRRQRVNPRAAIGVSGSPRTTTMCSQRLHSVLAQSTTPSVEEGGKAMQSKQEPGRSSGGSQTSASGQETSANQKSGASPRDAIRTMGSFAEKEDALRPPNQFAGRGGGGSEGPGPPRPPVFSPEGSRWFRER